MDNTEHSLLKLLKDRLARLVRNQGKLEVTEGWY